MRNLVIVESPAKAKTIEKYLGKDFHVVSSFGHIRDLPRKDISIAVDKNFEPSYAISTDKKKLVTELKKQVKASDIIWLASDEDREGEAIAWHLFEVLKLKNKDTKRIVFNEITKTAILEAIKNPKEIDLKLVDAQQARRVLDRIVGYELSPVLWRKVKSANSAGRVQSVAVRIIVERERQINKFSSVNSYKITGTFKLNKKLVKAELSSKIKTLKEAKELLQKFQNSEFSVTNTTKKDSKRSPASPFTTSSLQQEANRKMGFSVSQTMVVAQQLYEAGLITYMRTDSTNLSDNAIKQISEVVTQKFGKEYLKIRKYKTKSKNAQEAHEAIRPSDLSNNNPDISDSQQERLYKLIYTRAMASQMSDALIEKTNIQISSNNASESFAAKGEVIKFEGFMKVYIESTDNENDSEESDLLPKVNIGDKVEYKEIQAKEVFTKHPARYTEASLVRKLEELGIGRPSTYAPTITTIQKRNYVLNESRDGDERSYNLITLKNEVIKESENTEIFGAEKKKMFPTDVGCIVTDYLVERFSNILDYSFTANIETQFDEIAEGKTKWQDMMREFYDPFHSKVEEAKKIEGTTNGERLLGEDPKTGKNIYVKVGRFGPMAQLGDISDEEDAEKPKFASLLKGQSIETITLEQTIELFKLPRVLGLNDEGKEIKANIGRFGPYVQLGSTFASITKDLDVDVMSIELCDALVLINDKIEKDKQKTINIFKEEKADVKVLNGRYGAYISYKRKNYKIPKTVEAEKLTHKDCLEIINKSSKKKVKKSKK